MKITKLEYQKLDPNRVSVFVDGQYAVGVNAGDVLTLGLYKDKEISPEELNKIIGQSEYGKLLNFALNFLSFRPRSEWEVRRHLKKKDTDEDQLTNRVVEKLKNIKQIDDESFARWFVDQRNTFRPKGKRFLEHELRSKGIQSEVIKKVLGEDDTNEFEKAWLIVIKKKLTDREKIIRFLGTRGFSWDTINEVLAKLKTND